jgi:hypothetical protein
VRNLEGDTRAVQAALNRFLPIDGGPAPLLKVDGICGPLTKAEIVHFQEKWDLKPKNSDTVDGIVDPAGPTIDRLRAGPGRVPSGPTEFSERIPDVRQVVTAANAAIEAAIFHLQFGNRSGLLPSVNQLGQIAAARAERNFHISQSKTAISSLGTVQRIYFAMLTAIGHVPRGIILAVDEPPEVAVGAFMFSVAGGYSIQDPTALIDGTNLAVGSIYVCPKARALSKEAFAYVMIHELAHFVGPKSPEKPGEADIGIHDFGYFHRGTIGRLSSDQATHNADSFAQFAFDAIGKPNFNILTLGSATGRP